MSTHQVVAVGDLHLQSTHPRNQARLDALDFVIGWGEQLEHLAAWLLLGDVWHGRSTVEDRADLAARVQRMAALAPVLIVVGNHEQPGDPELLAKLASRWPILVSAAPEMLHVPTATGATLAVAMLPYPHKAGLVASGVAANGTLQTGGEYLDAILREFGPQLDDARERGELTLFMGHVNVAGSMASNGQPQIGREIELAPASLDLLGSTPKLLGHIHKPQAIHGAEYVGSVCRLDFGEVEEKHAIVLDYDDAGRSTMWPIAIPVAPMYRVEGNLTRDGFTLDPGDYPATWDEAEVRVRYRFAASERNVLDHGLARVPFESALRLELEPVAVPDRALRAPEVASAKTLADKLHAWATFSGASMTDALLDKLARLEHGDPTATLSAIATEIAAVEHAEKAERAA